MEQTWHADTFLDDTHVQSKGFIIAKTQVLAVVGSGFRAFATLYKGFWFLLDLR